MAQRLNGKVAVVTGSGRGFGRAVALAYASEGARLVAVARSRDELLQTEAMIRESGAEAHAVQADLATDDGLNRLVGEAEGVFGGVDVLVNNAAANPWLTLEEMTLSHWDRVMAVNLRAPFALSKTLALWMAKRGGGSIINVSSRSAEQGFVAEAAYCPSKYGLEGLTQCLALELKRLNVAVNSLNVAATPSRRLKPTGLTLREAEAMPMDVQSLYADDWDMVEHFRDAWAFLALQDGRGVTAQRLGTRELARVLKVEGEAAAYRRWSGKLTQAVYTPIPWPERVRYQTRGGGWRELVF
jgi:NAD(P)-dependent dehydrogenase (short-subunit alcohol dehydrogenase family)